MTLPCVLIPGVPLFCLEPNCTNVFEWDAAHYWDAARAHHSTTTMTVVKESKLQEALEGLKEVSFLQLRELLSFLMCQRLPYGISTDRRKTRVESHEEQQYLDKD